MMLRKVYLGIWTSIWGSLPTGSYQNGSKKRYGSNGNSFVCTVEFGPKVKPNHYCRGNSGNTQSKHFYDQAEMYQKVNSKTFYFTKKIY
jgi:acyl-homoserine lactone acylase PvdQ